ncbi:MAG: GNAT family N-acetyltransferase [Planctomycetota bacterium]
MVVRRATPADAREIAAIHVGSWQVAYRGIVPQAYLDSLSVDRREIAWRDSLEKDTTHTWVAVEADSVRGWIRVARCRDPDADSSSGEVWAIYVHPQHWRRGVARRLWTEAEAYLESAGYDRVTLWVLKENEPALAFYASIGFAIDPGCEKTIELGGAQLAEIRLRHWLGS